MESWRNVVSPANVRWSHATNSVSKLREALDGKAYDMIEADVQWGTLIGGHFANVAMTEGPIMAHPPATSSDLSFDAFLETIIARNRKVPDSQLGLKLDFKGTSAMSTVTDMT